MIPLRRPRADGAAEAVRLYGVLSAGHGDEGSAAAPRPGRRIGTPVGLAAVELLRVRDLAAAVAPAPFAAAAPTPDELAAVHAVVGTLFAERAVLPAPPGTVFRSRRAVAAWLELHAATLADGLRFVEDRVEARVHVGRAPADAVPPAALAESGSPLAGVLRALRREAAAVLVLRDEAGPDEPREAAEETAPGAFAPGAFAQAAFLVERTRWDVFAAAVAREQDARPALRLALTGPWPPYDFVRLDLGA